MLVLTRTRARTGLEHALLRQPALQVLRPAPALGLLQYSQIAMSTHFFSIAVDIRLLIYEELLVLSAPIVFRTTLDPLLPRLVLSQRYDLCPALLRTNKMVHLEATLFQQQL